MQRTAYIICIYFACVILSSGCEKKPSADFTLDKESYNCGEAVIITNVPSESADHFYLSVFDPNGNELKKIVTPQFKNEPQNKVHSFKLATYALEGTYVVRLKAVGHKEKKYTVRERTFTVNPITYGRVWIYVTNYKRWNYPTYDRKLLYVDGLDLKYDSAWNAGFGPDLGTGPGLITKYSALLPVGTRVISAVYSMSGTAAAVDVVMNKISEVHL